MQPRIKHLSVVVHDDQRVCDIGWREKWRQVLICHRAPVKGELLQLFRCAKSAQCVQMNPRVIRQMLDFEQLLSDTAQPARWTRSELTLIFS